MKCKTYWAYSNLLAIRCPQLFESIARTSPQLEITIKLKCCKSFELLLNYLNTGNFPDLKQILIDMKLFKKEDVKA